MKSILTAGQTSYACPIFILDSSKTDGSGLTGLAFNSGSLTWYYWREDTGNAAGSAVTLATMTRGTWATGGFVEIDATNMPGFYEISVPNAVIASGAKWATMILRGAANMAPVTIEFQLVAFDIFNATPAVNTTKIEGSDATDQIRDSIVDDTTRFHGASIATITAATLAAALRTALGLASANVDTQLSAIKTDVDAIPTTKTGYALTSPYDPAKTAAQAGDLMGLANGAITAAKFATDAIDANALKADAVTEIKTAVADQVWDEAAADHVASGSMGEALGAAGASGDPWITTVPGSYSAGQAGYILGTNLDAQVSAVGGGTPPTVEEIVDGILDEAIAGHNTAGTVGKKLIDIPTATYTVPTADENAIAFFQHDAADEEDTAPPNSITGMVLKGTSKVLDTGTEMETYKTNGDDVFMTQDITRASRTNPITQVTVGV